MTQAFLLPIKASLDSAWQRVHGAKGTILGAFAILVISMFIIGFIEGFIEGLVQNSILTGILNAITQFIGFLFQIGFIYIGIQRAYDLPINYKMIFHGFKTPLVAKAIGLYFIQGLILFAVIFPTIILASLLSIDGSATGPLSILIFALGFAVFIFLVIRMSLALGLIADKMLGPIEAIKRSFIATRHNFWRLCALFFINLIILVISVIPLGIGLIWALPFSIILYGVIYKELLTNAK